MQQRISQSIADALSKGQLSALVIQVLVLAADIYLYFEMQWANGFIIASAIFVFSLIGLQVGSRRFTILYPWQGFAKHHTRHLDTYILRLLIIFSILFLLLGALYEYEISIAITFYNFLLGYDVIVKLFLFLLFPILPIFWCLIGEHWMVYRVVSFLNERITPLHSRNICTECYEGRLEVRKEIIQNNIGRTIKRCPSCNFEFHYDIEIMVGY